MPSTLAHQTCRAMPFVLERQRCAMSAVAGEPLTAPHLAGAHLGWAIRGARGLEKTEGEASEVLEVLEVGLAPGTRPAAEGLMAKMMVSPMQCQIGFPSKSLQGKTMITSKMWNSLLLNAQRSKTKRNISAFKVLAVKSDNGVVSRLEDLLKLDMAPFTDKIIAEYIWYGIEQEYTLLQTNVKWPLGWPVGGYPDAHYKACLYAGINISGTNGEILFLFNLLTNIEDGQELIKEISILKSVFSLSIFGNIRLGQVTKSMREEGGYEVIKKAILNLSLRHMDHISAYGEGNERRLTGKHETANINTFSWGVANRGCSIRVGRDTEKQGKGNVSGTLADGSRKRELLIDVVWVWFVDDLGYLEDRRPASNMDPYVVTSLLAETTILWQPSLEAEARAAKELQLQV
ncbi:hypothetical protein GW17_00000514 [Ensete ventricosum]|nr:hypothetical protein GW17_00000514 [Ensete ventricosum]